MKALLDGDIVVHRVGYTTDDLPLGIAKARADEMLEKIIFDVGANEYEVWLTDSYENNFRKHLYPLYKANRVQPRPVHYEALKEYLFEEWNTNLALGMEADDALGIQQTKYFSDDPEFGGSPHDCIICSIDKDLLQIPGQHYNFVKEEFTNVTIKEGLVNFYLQLVMGDRSDNIGGFDGIMRQSLPKFLSPVKDNLVACKNEEDMYKIVLDLYSGDKERLILNGKLLWIRRKDNEVWSPPQNT